MTALDFGALRNYATVPDVGDIPAMGFDDMPVRDTASDGVPWRKCCGECQYRDRPSIPLVEAECRAKGAAFYCVHRADDGRFRVCAGFAARDRATPAPDGRRGDV